MAREWSEKGGGNRGWRISWKTCFGGGVWEDKGQKGIFDDSGNRRLVCQYWEVYSGEKGEAVGKIAGVSDIAFLNKYFILVLQSVFFSAFVCLFIHLFIRAC